MKKIESENNLNKKWITEYLNSEECKRSAEFFGAAEEARKKAGIEGIVGKVEFACPLCGEKCVSNFFYLCGKELDRNSFHSRRKKLNSDNLLCRREIHGSVGCRNCHIWLQS